MIRTDSLGRQYWWEPRARGAYFRSEAWMRRAFCRGVDADVFYPGRGRGSRWTGTSLAKSMCRRCEVTEECLAWALKHNERQGVWGGLSPRERKELRRQQA